MNETAEKNVVRLEMVRTQQALSRSSETVVQKKDRLQSLQSYQKASRSSETAKQKRIVQRKSDYTIKPLDVESGGS